MAGRSHHLGPYNFAPITGDTVATVSIDSFRQYPFICINCGIEDGNRSIMRFSSLINVEVISGPGYSDQYLFHNNVIPCIGYNGSQGFVVYVAFGSYTSMILTVYKIPNSDWTFTTIQIYGIIA